ncbi:MAG: MBL fold metallo-hydrolase [Aigarchaeota archaeon]|nr:MBL fold metallo-hydrolase [Aigarchaeota archaeon]
MKTLVKPGKITEGVYMIDAGGYGSEKTTSIFVLKGSRFSAILDTGSRRSAEPILRGLREMRVDPDHVQYLLVSHRHTDHAGGAGPLLKGLPRAVACGHSYTIDTLRDPAKINAAAVAMFGEYGEAMEPITNLSRLLALNPGQLVDLGDLEVEAVHTPGHTSDHYCFYEKKEKFLFCGDAAGLLGSTTLSTTPTTFPPSFKYEPYLSSLQKLLRYDLETVAFAHFGAVTGEDAAQIIHKSIATLKEWREIAETEQRDPEALLEKLWIRHETKLEVFPIEFRRLAFSMLANGFVNGLPSPGE